ncbi:homoserine kinase [Methylobacter tundripaludum]|uniref:homoserine kinase n=1 Tax=Methylobacter tundripaludum TaxID=173365 RepID=UPI0004DECBF9|nr:homoserine kinase [Methylobacter tundripaludum]
MSVFTRITRPQLDQFFSAYTLGEVVSFEGITDGIDNTNYFVTTTQGSFVLTLFESLTADELPHFLKLLAHLGENNLPCPRPQSDRQANPLRQLNGKPAAVFKRLSGTATAIPSILYCQEIGLQLASLHRCTEGYVFPIKNGNDLSWCKTALSKVGAHLSATDRELIDDELAFQAENTPVNLPRGVIHADLFRDNVLFVDGRLSGLLDFYSACTDTLLLDVAITANDWCCDNGTVNAEKFTALLSAYESLRPLEPQEKQHWPILLRAAALRFWLSRLEHQCYPRPGEITQQKDPLIFRRILLQHRQQTYLSSNANIFNLRSTA